MTKHQTNNSFKDVKFSPVRISATAGHETSGSSSHTSRPTSPEKVLVHELGRKRLYFSNTVLRFSFDFYDQRN